MAGNLFLRFVKDSTPVKAESLATDYPGIKGWIEINGWTWNIVSETSIAKGSGASLGKATCEEFSWEHNYDTASPAIMTNIVKGTTFKNAQLVMLKQDNSTGKNQPYFALNMHDVYITGVDNSGSEDGNVTQGVKMVFVKIDVGYYVQNPHGDIIKTLIPFSWDIPRQVVTESGDDPFKAVS